jgi:hypothetical protein
VPTSKTLDFQGFRRFRACMGYCIAATLLQFCNGSSVKTSSLSLSESMCFLWQMQKTRTWSADFLLICP